MAEHPRTGGEREFRTESSDDLETRARLLNSAARLFAERGFARVTVRDICKKARANVAAVNYHFGGKHGLYQAVMQMAMETMQGTTEAARAAGGGLPAEQRLRAYVLVFAERLLGAHYDTWIHQLMMREMSDPTPALRVVAEVVLKPRLLYLCGVIAELLGRDIDDPVVVRCALSVTSQFNSLLWTKAVGELLNSPATVPDNVTQIGEHIARFCLAGVQQLRLTPDATDKPGDTRR
jgi:AcrR family transcriptional regulator